MLVAYSGPRFFSLPMPGSTMLLLDFIQAANGIISAVDLKNVSVLFKYTKTSHVFKNIMCHKLVNLIST